MFSKVIPEDLEEGEIVSEAAMQKFAKQLGVNPNQISFMPAVPESPPEDVDEVEMEDITSDEYPSYMSPPNSNIPDFAELFKRNAREEMNRQVPQERNPADNEDNVIRNTFLSRVQDIKKLFKPVFSPNYKMFYRLQKKSSSGQIISWAYLDDLRAFAIKRERGIQYFRLVNDIQTLPYFDVHQLARLRLLYSEDDGMARFFEKKLREEFKKGWKMIKPQLPEIRQHPTKKHSITGKPLLINKYKAPATMRIVPLRKMRQDFTNMFRFWYYDYTTTEAVIVLGKDDEEDDWEAVRVFDPMWLRNLSKTDVETLHQNPIIFVEEDREQASFFQAVIRVCYEHKAHA